MNFKQAVIKTVDIFLAFGFIILGIVVAMLATSGFVGQALIVSVVGWIVLCSISGFWFILSSINDSLVKQTKILEKMLDKGE